MESLLKYGINCENLDIVADWAKDFAVSKGILRRSQELSVDTRVLLPFCLVPSGVPEKWFQLVKDLQPIISSVLFKISHSRDFLKDCLTSTIEADEFTANIFRIYEQVEKEDNEEQLSLGLIRSDYLLDSDSSGNITGIKQVENNTISSSFGGLSPYVRDLHQYILSRLGKTELVNKLPKNDCLDGLAKGLIAAWEAYNKPRSVILFVVEEFTSNICDQRSLEHAIVRLRSDIEIVRCSFKELRNAIRLEGNILMLVDKEVAVVYYRTGYMPDQYEVEDWKTRLMMERSEAVKCPSAGLHLAGTKRVQLELARPGVLEKFTEPDLAKKLRQVFVKQYSLEMGDEGDKAVKLGIENPKKYVLKPEREGGGNNVYGEDIRPFLEGIKSSPQREAYILMDMINAPHISNCIVYKDQPPVPQPVICELGIYGVILGDKKSIRLNEAAGHLLRSKESTLNETGVAAGFGGLDSPCLL